MKSDVNALVSAQKIRFWVLVRGIGPTESLVFQLLVTVEKAEASLYSATISGMAGRLSAFGDSEDEAAEHAIAVFELVVDTVIQDKLPLRLVVGPMVAFHRTQISIEQAREVFKDFADIIVTSLAGSDDWLIMPITGAFIPFAEAVPVG